MQPTPVASPDKCRAERKTKGEKNIELKKIHDTIFQIPSNRQRAIRRFKKNKKKERKND